ncbi:hypothetical protein [Synechococcus sp. CCFWC 502]|nr:hypothetical protein [Synechococcus sp. CCFWC 502]WFN58696.1 hypothetical protein N4320_13005 [Synechococcus sp. CCFWC 502]
MAVLAPISGLMPLLAIAVIAIVSVLTFGTRASGVLPSLVVFVLALRGPPWRAARAWWALCGVVGATGQPWCPKSASVPDPACLILLSGKAKFLMTN